MSATSLLLLFGSAGLHVIQHVLLKRARNRTAFVWWVWLWAAVLFSPVLVLCWQPIPLYVWGIMAVSTAFGALYYLAIVRAYQTGDLSVVYPLARGTAPILVFLWTALLLQERPSLGGVAGIGLIAAGLAVINLPRLGAWRQVVRSLGQAAPRWALAAGLCISLYTTLDKVAVSLTGALLYTYLAMTLTFLWLTPAALREVGTRGLVQEARSSWMGSALAGFSAMAAYGIVLFVMRGGELASYVGAVREISVVFGAVVGVAFLKETGTVPRVLGSGLITGGVGAIAALGVTGDLNYSRYIHGDSTMTRILSAARDKVLFTPGPLTTSAAVKRAMLRDLGSRDREFMAVVREVRRELLAVAGVSQEQGYEAVPLQGSGTYGVEAVLTCATPPAGRWLIVSNGAYGERMARIARIHGIAHTVLRCPEDARPDPAAVDRALAADPTITGVAIVHCETTTGILNPVEEIGLVAKRHGTTYVLDSMSAFGGVEFDLEATGADFLVSSANKCLEGVPGLAFCLCRRDHLERTSGQSRTLSLDLFDQWRALEETGQFRFTPPTHALLAFRQALDELAQEGGVAGRAARYRANHETLVAGMKALGFKPYLSPELQSPIITSFRYPADERFDFATFSDRLNDRGFVIYPGKVSRADCFRIGTIGRIFPADIHALLRAVEQTIAVIFSAGREILGRKTRIVLQQVTGR